MCFFRRKNQADKTKEDRELVADNAKSVEALIVLAKDNDAMIQKLKDLQEKLKYLIPTADSKIASFDKSIKNKLGDLRIALTKANGEESKKVDELLEEIFVTIADRNVKI